MKKSIALILVLLLFALSAVGCGTQTAETGDETSAELSSGTGSEAENGDDASEDSAADHTPSIHWSNDTTVKYLHDDEVQSIICVEATSQTTARVLMFEKSVENGNTLWTKTLECEGYIGLDGLGQTREDNCMTPIGDFGIITAFGIKANPGTALPYVDVTDDTYCCGDDTAYNQIIDISECPHECDGEHMIDYSPEYNYGFFLDYNSDCVQGMGSAIFFHCSGAKVYTGACIAVDEPNMVQILQAIDENTRVIIDYATDYEE